MPLSSVACWQQTSGDHCLSKPNFWVYVKLQTSVKQWWADAKTEDVQENGLIISLSRRHEVKPKALLRSLVQHFSILLSRWLL